MNQRLRLRATDRRTPRPAHPPCPHPRIERRKLSSRAIPQGCRTAARSPNRLIRNAAARRHAKGPDRAPSHDVSWRILTPANWRSFAPALTISQTTTPELQGTVDTVAAGLSSDARTGESWYAVRIRVPQEEIAKPGTLSLVPGMPVETFIQTGERTALSFLLKPLRDQFARAFREE